VGELISCSISARVSGGMAQAVDPATSGAQSAKIQLVGRRGVMFAPVGGRRRKPQKNFGDHAARGCSL
jgi:hypothetical protein